MRILLTAIGKRVQLINHLRIRNYIVGVDAGDLSPAQYFVDSFQQVPLCSDKNYVNVLLEICTKERIDTLIPLYEKEFLILDKYRGEFKKAGTTLLLSDKHILEICNDKWNTYNFFKQNNINTPNTYLSEEIKLNFIDINYPVILKPRDGMGSRGILHVGSKEALLNITPKLDNYIVQERIKGTEFTLDVLCDLEGQVISIVPRQRLEIRAGEVSKSKSVKDYSLINTTLDLVNKMNSKDSIKTIGPINIQCIVDKVGEIKFIEINPRFGGGAPLTFESGVNYGKILEDMILGKKIEPAIGEFEELIMLRFDDAVFIK